MFCSVFPCHWSSPDQWPDIEAKPELETELQLLCSQDPASWVKNVSFQVVYDYFLFHLSFPPHSPWYNAATWLGTGRWLVKPWYTLHGRTVLGPSASRPGSRAHCLVPASSPWATWKVVRSPWKREYCHDPHLIFRVLFEMSATFCLVIPLFPCSFLDILSLWL